MARDSVNRTDDPGESEFAGAPDDPRVGIVPGYDVDGKQAADVRGLLDAYWTNPADPASQPDPDGSNIGDSAERNRRRTVIQRKNQFRSSVLPTFNKQREP
jgi:hypothetical protein